MSVLEVVTEKDKVSSIFINYEQYNDMLITEYNQIFSFTLLSTWI
jgi:hypothetical protein